jgi:hypothetical protein
MLHPNFVILGTLIGAVGSIAYLLDTLKGRVKPNRVSFLMWSIAPLIAFAAQLSQGIGIESLMTLSVGLMPLLIFIASFLNKEAEWQLSRFDIICGVLSFIGLGLWLITKVGNVAIFFSILADGLAAIPTVVKAYKYPETEIAWPWIMTTIGVLLTLFTLESLTFENSGFIIYVMLINVLIYALVKFKLGVRSKPVLD